jgi:hypothetical protein
MKTFRNNLTFALVTTLVALPSLALGVSIAAKMHTLERFENA